MEREPLGYTQEDWDEVSDNPELTEEDFKRARPGREVFPGLAEAVARRRGRPKAEAPKVHLNLRIDADVLEGYRATGAGWQTRMNAVLRAGLPGIGGRAAPFSGDHGRGGTVAETESGPRGQGAIRKAASHGRKRR
jgi:uncharacterized protein (DUF4415 family)